MAALQVPLVGQQSHLTDPGVSTGHSRGVSREHFLSGHHHALGIEASESPYDFLVRFAVELNERRAGREDQANYRIEIRVLEYVGCCCVTNGAIRQSGSKLCEPDPAEARADRSPLDPFVETVSVPGPRLEP